MAILPFIQGIGTLFSMFQNSSGSSDGSGSDFSEFVRTHVKKNSATYQDALKRYQNGEIDEETASLFGLNGKSTTSYGGYDLTYSGEDGDSKGYNAGSLNKVRDTWQSQLDYQNNIALYNYDRQLQDQIALRDNERAYQSPEQQKARLQAAGINPQLALGSGNLQGTSTQSAPSVNGSSSFAPIDSRQQMDNSNMVNLLGVISQFIGQQQQVQINEKANEADVQQKNAQTTNQLIRNLTQYNRDIADLKETLSRTAKTDKEYQSLQAQIKTMEDLRDGQKRLLDEQANFYRDSATNQVSQTGLNTQQTSNLKEQKKWIAPTAKAEIYKAITQGDYNKALELLTNSETVGQDIDNAVSKEDYELAYGGLKKLRESDTRGYRLLQQRMAKNYFRSQDLLEIANELAFKEADLHEAEVTFQRGGYDNFLVRQLKYLFEATGGGSAFAAAIGILVGRGASVGYQGVKRLASPRRPIGFHP